jgi:23S rRNA (adenine2503-C2)-methyltransferase
MPDDTLINLFGLPREQFESLCAEVDGKPYRAHQMMKWAYHERVLDFMAMTNLSRKFRSWLCDHAEFKVPEIVRRLDSADGTIKWVIKVSADAKASKSADVKTSKSAAAKASIEGKAADENHVEAVLIPERGRNTLCVSSQVGCMLDCTFCSTGKQGFNGNLTTAEIVGQVWLANQALRERNESVTNVVLMGMGEPLLNFNSVMAATRLMLDDLAFGLSKRRVTVSTAGVVPAIYEMAKCSDVSLAVSLHAPNDELRNELVPLNRKYPIAELLDACRHYIGGLGDKRTLTIEYTLLRGVNDQLEQAEQLATLLRDVRCKINLIPFNPFPASGFQRPDEDSVRAFQSHLIRAGYTTMLRTTRGEDINAACGQLVGQVNDRTRRQARYLARVRAQVA